MKKTKRILAVVLTVIMLMATMATTAMAAGTATIKITNTHVGATYTLYKLLDLESYSGANYSYKVTPEWETFFRSGDGSPFVTVDTNGYVSWNTGSAAELAKKAGENLAGKTVYGPYTATGTTLSINDLEEGYYLIKSSQGTLFGVATAENGNTRTIAEKTGLPNLSKTATDNATIGNTVEYKVTLNVETGGTNYVMFDKMEAGLTFNSGSVAVKYGVDGTMADVLSGYTVTEGSLGDLFTFKIAFDDAAVTYETGKKLEITYTATLNENAEIYSETNDNTVWMTHGSGTRVDGNIVSTKTFKFDLVKTDASNKVLDGAKFELYKADGTTPIPVVKVSDGVYRVAVAGETGVEIETKSGVATIQGLGNGTYKLKETAAPAGYNKITTLADVTISGDNNPATVTGDTYTSGGVQIVNNAGALLPETGGMGTTIFYLTGTMLVLGAVVLMALKKRQAMQA